MQEVLFTQDVTMFDFIIRMSIGIGWIIMLVAYFVGKWKEKRDYEKWRKTSSLNSSKEHFRNEKNGLPERRRSLISELPS